MKTILKTIAAVSLMPLSSLTCGADEASMHLTRDQNSTNLITTWRGQSISPEQLRRNIEQVGRVAHIYNYKLPIRFSPEITFQELLSVVDTVYAAGVTNISLQLVSNPVPSKAASKNKTEIVIQDYSREPPIQTMVFPGEESEKAEPDSGQDIQVDTGGL